MLGLARVSHQHRVVENQLFHAIGSTVGSKHGAGWSIPCLWVIKGPVITQAIGWGIFALAASGLFVSLRGWTIYVA
jgi:hypothetical protein